MVLKVAAQMKFKLAHSSVASTSITWLSPVAALHPFCKPRGIFSGWPARKYGPSVDFINGKHLSIQLVLYFHD